MHTLCAGKPESDDRGNNISVKRLGTSLDRCIERYIKKTDYYYYYYKKKPTNVMYCPFPAYSLYAKEVHILRIGCMILSQI